MKNSTIACILLTFVAIMPACKSTKQVQSQAPVITEMPSTEPVVSVQQQSPDTVVAPPLDQLSLTFDWFSANLNGTVNMNGDQMSFGGQLRIKNNEQIWIMISAMGGLMEVARLKVTPDSVFLYNKYEKTATIRDLGFFKELTGIDFTFDMLQNLLIGIYSLDYPAVKINYENYDIFNGAEVPQRIIVEMKEPTLFELQLNYQRIQVNVPQNMPFSIPESVKKI
ncbi:MAG: DUF4292 domain-containing protein [Bacteroidales bacterium]|jgi:hypothetical protein|nr:DUF4292 domain-containing protein [Bacteroidales bacterium]